MAVYSGGVQILFGENQDRVDRAMPMFVDVGFFLKTSSCWAALRFCDIRDKNLWSFDQLMAAYMCRFLVENIIMDAHISTSILWLHQTFKP